MSNVSNQIAILTALQTLITTIEADASVWRSGDPNLDAVSQQLLTTRLDLMIGNLLNNGSRAQANANAAARAAANNMLAHAVDPLYTALDTYMRQLAAQITVLNNPTSVGRRVHTANQ